MNKRVWIWNHYAGSMYEEQGGRHYAFAKYLRQAGYEPVVFCCNARHGKAETYFPDMDLWQEHEAEEIGVPFVFVQGRTYGGNGAQRVLNMVDFYQNVKKTARAYAKARGKPDVIYASSVHPLTLVAGIQTAKHFGVRCVCEVRDLWPESIVAYSNRFTRENPLIRLLYRGEKWIYQRADALIFTMEGGYDYITERGWERAIPRSKVHCINNGVDLEQFREHRARFRVEDADLQDPALFKVVYIGSIRRVNQLGALLDAAKQVTDPTVRFLVWGDGDQRAALERRVQEEGITNVILKGKVEKKYIPDIVTKADLNLIHGSNDGRSLLRFGISTNKMFDCFAAGKPILMDIAAGYNPVEQFYAGVCVDCPEVLSQAIAGLRQADGDVLGSLCRNAERAAEAYDYRQLTERLIKVLEKER